MKICLIDPDPKYAQCFHDMVKDYGSVVHVQCAKDFKDIRHLDWDAIVVEYDLPEIRGDILIEGVQDRTSAEFAIIGLGCKHYCEKNLKNPRITGLFQKNKYAYKEITVWIEMIILQKRLLKRLESALLEEA